MTRTRRPALILGTVALSALLLAGCTMNGGGWMSSNNGAKKATFGFTWQGEEITLPFPPFVFVEPTLAQGFWSDGSVKFRILNGGIVGGSMSDPCLEGEAEYRSQSRAHPGGGDLSIEFCDWGEPGPSAGDELSIDVESGPYSWYANSGELRGGNLQRVDDD